MNNYQKIYSYLLLGTISVLFAEVISGSSQVWLLDILAIILMFPLYLFHTTFLLGLALKTNKISIKSLYFLGVLYGLYEGLITKVIWSGYMNEDGPGFGTIMGLSMPESIILIFLWHPIMSLILPIFSFQIIKGKIIENHKYLLTKTKKKTILLYLAFLIFSTFLAQGNDYNIVSANIAYLSTLGLFLLLNKLSNNSNINIFKFSEKSFKIQSRILILLYIIGFIIFVPENLPKYFLPYFTTLALYLLAIFNFKKSKTQTIKLIDTDRTLYSISDLKKLGFFVFISLNIASIIGPISFTISIIGYILMFIIGILLFFYSIFYSIKKQTNT